jgi:hypothetical protein
MGVPTGVPDRCPTESKARWRQIVLQSLQARGFLAQVVRGICVSYGKAAVCRGRLHGLHPRVGRSRGSNRLEKCGKSPATAAPLKTRTCIIVIFDSCRRKANDADRLAMTTAISAPHTVFSCVGTRQERCRWVWRSDGFAASFCGGSIVSPVTCRGLHPTSAFCEQMSTEQCSASPTLSTLRPSCDFINWAPARADPIVVFSPRFPSLLSSSLFLPSPQPLLSSPRLHCTLRTSPSLFVDTHRTSSSWPPTSSRRSTPTSSLSHDSSPKSNQRSRRRLVTSRRLLGKVRREMTSDNLGRLLCHALQFAFKSIAYYIRRATLINVCRV